MATWVDGMIVSVIALGATILIGVLGWLMDKNSEDRNG